jgi:hypothetical protein
MALLNNTGHAHVCLGNKEKANACFQLLLETLICVVDQGKPNAFGSSWIPVVSRIGIIHGAFELVSIQGLPSIRLCEMSVFDSL